MSELMRLVTIDDVGRARLVMDLNTGAGSFRLRDSFAIGAPARKDRAAAGASRYQGTRIELGNLDNGSVGATIVVRDPGGTGNANRAAAELERILNVADRAHPARTLYLEWRPDTLPRSVFFPLQGPAACAVAYNVRQWAGTHAAHVTATWPTAPLGEGLPLDLREDFRAPPDKPSGNTNRVRNPSGEVNVAYWAAQASAGSPAAPAQVADPRTGSVGAQAIETSVAVAAGGTLAIGESGWNDALHRCDPGDRVYGRGWLKALASAGAPSSLALWLEFFNSATGFVGGTVVAFTNSPAAGAWTEFAGATVAPAGAAYYRILGQATYSAAATATLRIDDFISALNPVTDPTTYGDGDYNTWRWDGIPHASASVELAESVLADYTVESGAPIVRVDLASDSAGIGSAGPNNGLYAANGQAATEQRIRHTGRGYSFYDGAIAIGMRAPAQAGASPWSGTTTAKAQKRLGAAGAAVMAQLDLTSLAGTLSVVRQAPFAAAGTTLASVATPTPIVGARYWVRLVTAGRYVRAELWTSSPLRGGAPGTVTAWADAGRDLDGPGQAAFAFTNGSGGTYTTAYVFELLEQPHTFPDVRTPDQLLMRGIPGNAPARAELEVSYNRDNAGGPDFGVYGWRRRRQPHNLIWNGGPTPNAGNLVSGWSSTARVGLNAGGAVAYNDAFHGGIPDQAPSLTISSGAAGTFTGAAFRFYDRIRRGRLYTLEVYVQASTEAANWQIALEDPSSAGNEVIIAPAGSLPAASGRWERTVVTFVAVAPLRVGDLVISRPATGAGGINVNRVRLYEGLPEEGPRTAGQSNGRGAVPPFGTLAANNDDRGFRVNAADVTDGASAPDPGAITGTSLRFSGTTGHARYLIDPALIPGVDLEAGDVDVEVYAALKIPPANNPTIVAYTVPGQATAGTERRTYTREFGAAGRTIIRNSLTATRLGTLPLTYDGRLTGRLWLCLDYSIAAAANVDLRHLFIIPTRRRQGTPTGKVLDASYPRFAALAGITIASPMLKTFDTNGRGIVAAADGGTYRDAGTGGEPFEPEPGTSELALWSTSRSIPDEPSGAGSPYDTTFNYVHVRVTPRYRLVRDA